VGVEGGGGGLCERAPRGGDLIVRGGRVMAVAVSRRSCDRDTCARGLLIQAAPGLGDGLLHWERLGRAGGGVGECDLGGRCDRAVRMCVAHGR